MEKRPPDPIWTDLAALAFELLARASRAPDETARRRKDRRRVPEEAKR